jgi:hypothetical protein
MTPSQLELLERAHELRELYDELGETEGLSSLDTRVVRLLEDLIDELESA